MCCLKCYPFTKNFFESYTHSQSKERGGEREGRNRLFECWVEVIENIWYIWVMIMRMQMWKSSHLFYSQQYSKSECRLKAGCPRQRVDYHHASHNRYSKTRNANHHQRINLEFTKELSTNSPIFIYIPTLQYNFIISSVRSIYVYNYLISNCGMFFFNFYFFTFFLKFYPLLFWNIFCIFDYFFNWVQISFFRHVAFYLFSMELFLLGNFIFTLKIV